MVSMHLVLWIAGAVCFLLAAIGVPSRVGLGWLGLFFASLVRVLLVAVLLALGAAPVFAQTHPCDVAQGATFTVTAQELPQFFLCEPTSAQTTDSTGATVTVPFTVTGINVYLSNGSTFTLSNASVVTGTPSSAGLLQYTAKMTTTLPKGTYTVQVTAVNISGTGAVQESPKSSPFALSVVDTTTTTGVPVPPQPTHISVQ